MTPSALRLDPDRAADGPLRLRLRSWPGTLRRTGSEFVDDHLLQWAAALTFFAVLSVFPAMLALVSVLALLGSSALQPLVENVSALAPGTARDVTLDALRSIERSRGDAGPALAVDNFGTFSATYGSIGGVLVFLIWLWLSNIAILLGAELDAEIERTRAIEAGLRPPDKTTFLPKRDGRP